MLLLCGGIKAFELLKECTRSEAAANSSSFKAIKGRLQLMVGRLVDA